MAILIDAVTVVVTFRRSTSTIRAAAAEPPVAPETEPDTPWYKRWFR